VRAAPWACLGAAGGRPIERRAVPLNLEGPEVPTNTFTKERPFTGVIVAKEKLGHRAPRLRGEHSGAAGCD